MELWITLLTPRNCGLLYQHHGIVDYFMNTMELWTTLLTPWNCGLFKATRPHLIIRFFMTFDTIELLTTYRHFNPHTFICA